VHVLRFEDWVGNPRNTYLEVLAFLGLDDDGRVDFQLVNEAKRHRSDTLGRMLQYPPKWLLPPIKLLKAALGKESLGLAEAVADLNRKSDRKGVDPQLKDEIRGFYREDNRLLEELLASEQLPA
jgi:hypothetical protein